MDRIVPFRSYLPVLIGAFIALIVLAGASWSIHFTSGSGFCMWCHEMQVVGEQGWMHSVHYDNPRGIVAECRDCHIPPELHHMLWVKARDGSKDVFMHVFGESDPSRMDWAELSISARKKIHDSACRTCHTDATPSGAPIKQIIAHRAYLRLNGAKKCLDCHREPFHGRYRDHIGNTHTHVSGGDS